MYACTHRQVLEDECDQYREDIAFLQSCLDGEHDFISSTLEEELKPQPTLQGILRQLDYMARHRPDGQQILHLYVRLYVDIQCGYTVVCPHTVHVHVIASGSLLHKRLVSICTVVSPAFTVVTTQHDTKVDSNSDMYMYILVSLRLYISQKSKNWIVFCMS